MNGQIRLEKHPYQVRSCGTENISDDIYYNYNDCREFQIQVLTEADKNNHRHRKYGKKQFVSYPSRTAKNSHHGMKCREYMYDA